LVEVALLAVAGGVQLDDQLDVDFVWVLFEVLVPVFMLQGLCHI
jgi:hypothetical protein